MSLLRLFLLVLGYLLLGAWMLWKVLAWVETPAGQEQIAAVKAAGGRDPSELTFGDYVVFLLAWPYLLFHQLNPGGRS